MNLGYVDDEPLPVEYEHLFTPDQLDKMLPRTLWVLLVRMAPPHVLDVKRKVTAFAIHTYVAGSSVAQCWPSQATLAISTGLGERTVRRALAELESDGWIERTSISRRQSHVISLCWPPYKPAQTGHQDRTQTGHQDRTQDLSAATGAPSAAIHDTSAATGAPSAATVAAEGVVEGVDEGESMASDGSSDDRVDFTLIRAKAGAGFVRDAS